MRAAGAAHRVTIHEIHDAKTTNVIDAYGSAFITAVATLDDDLMEVHLGEGGPGTLHRHIVAAITAECSPRRRRYLTNQLMPASRIAKHIPTSTVE